MSKPPLEPKQNQLETDIIHTMLAGLKRWRRDLDYPESYSDMSACVRALMVMYNIERIPLPVDLKVPCHFCMGIGYLISNDNGTPHMKTCHNCLGKRVEPNMVGQ